MAFLPLSVQLWLLKVSEALRTLAMAVEGPGLFLVALADSSFLSIPEANDLLIVILSTGKTWGRMSYYVLMTIVGSLSGCVLLYTVGRKGGNPLLRRKFSAGNVERWERLFRRYGILTVAVPSILPPPCPFKIFVLSAGVFRLSLPAFLLAVTIGRTVRYSMWGILAVMYGESVRTYMQENLTQVGLGLIGILAVALAIGTGVLVYRGRQRRLGA